jgi:hypothetical protein
MTYFYDNITTWSQSQLISYYNGEWDRLMKLYKKIDSSKTSQTKKYDLECEAKIVSEKCGWLEFLIKSKKQ